MSECACSQNSQTLFAMPDGRLLMRCNGCGKGEDVTEPITARRSKLERIGMIIGAIYGGIVWVLLALMTAVTLVPMAATAGALLVLFLCAFGLAMAKAWVLRWRTVGEKS